MDTPSTVLAKLQQFIVSHPRSLGLENGPGPLDLELSPHRVFHTTSGRLRIFRFVQTYRSLPIFGPDSIVRLIVAPDGALGIRGAIVDGRIEYEHLSAPSSATAAEVSIRQYVTEQTGLPASDLDIRDLRLVAVPRVRALGWAASVDDGLRHIATVVVEASPAVAGPPARLLYFDRDSSEGLADTVDVTVRAEDPASDVLSDPVSAVDQSTLFNDAAPLRGSLIGDQVALADERVVAYNGAGLDFMALTTTTPPFSGPTGLFSASPDSDEFDVQSAYLATQSMYAWTDRFMAGRWDSLLEGASPFPPGTFSPRVMVFENNASGCPDGAIFCASIVKVEAPAQIVPVEYQQPPGGPIFEPLGVIMFGQASHGPDTLGHEFGHFVDQFTNPGVISDGLTCADCESHCNPDTTDEAAALTETFANLASMWYLRDLYDVGQSPTSCAVPRAVSLGGDRGPHAEGCLDGSRVALFLPQAGCPDGFACDKIEPSDKSDSSGICNKSRGYRIDSFHQALWEAMHAQTCDVDPPHTCEPRPELLTEPAGDLIGSALLYALQVDTAIYRGFADDMATHVACNLGEASYKAFNEILCHHRIRECDAPTPVICETCGNGVVELDEACDGNDLVGKECVDLGFSGGTLMCDANCALDSSGCIVDLPTTSMDSGIPTTGPTETSTGVGADNDGAGGGAEDGCGCRSSQRVPVWHGLFLCALGLRHRRRLSACLALGGVLLTSPGCEADPGTGDTESTTGTTSTTGDTGELSRRMFGEFHNEGKDVGYVNPGMEVLVFKANLEIDPAGALFVSRSVCEEEPVLQSFTWTAIGEDTLQVTPEAYAPDGTFEFLAERVISVRLAAGSDCDDIKMVSEYHPDSGKPPSFLSWASGAFCAKPLGEQCHYELVWCDGAAPPMCGQGE